MKLTENQRLPKNGKEKGAYYYKEHVSLHPIYIWSSKEKFTKVATTDSTNKSYSTSSNDKSFVFAEGILTNYWYLLINLLVSMFII